MIMTGLEEAVRDILEDQQANAIIAIEERLLELRIVVVAGLKAQ
jgi:hypothetical protein